MSRYPKVEGPGYIVRDGKVRGKGRYLRCLELDNVHFGPNVAGCGRGSKRTAEKYAKAVGGRVVRLLTLSEAKRRAAATALRAETIGCVARAEHERKAARMVAAHVWEAAAESLAIRAEALWPLKAAKR